MKIASVIARYLLGLIFLVFGLNGFFGASGPVWGCDLRLALLGAYLRPSGSRRLTTFVESICGVGTGAAWTGNRKHFVLSLANGSRGDSAGSCRGGVVADSCGALQAISGGNFCAARGVKASLGEKAALPSPPLRLAGLSPIP